MAQHKAPTAVTIASTDQESEIRNWIAKYWVYGALLVVGLLIWVVYTQQSKTNSETKRRESWSKLLAVASQDPRTGMLAGAPDDLRRAGGELKGTDAGPWALYLAASSAAASRDFDRARSCLTELEQSYPHHPLVVQPFTEGTPALSPTKLLAKRMDDELAFVHDNPTLFSNPDLPADAPRVRLTTDKGAIVIGLYKDTAPKISENFLKLVKDGVYVGTKFHAVVKNEYIRGGDPNTIKGEAPTWGKGGPGYTLDKESNPLKNFAGVISATPDAGDPTKLSGSQFLITSADVHSLDDLYLPFGKVLEGLDVITTIENLPLAEKSFSQPKEPATILSAEVL